VLFVDEAYSLASETEADTYGAEAIQVLLKRMEDDRERLVVILAGYPAPMQEMLRSNPGLSSRFQRTITFPDYSAAELLQIFDVFCRKHHYQLSPAWMFVTSISGMRVWLGTSLRRRSGGWQHGWCGCPSKKEFAAALLFCT
jgi:SpoVK/Ycf46/Vps4 family AAA+-type ATPase